MAQKRLTITLPGSAEALHNALQMLLQYGLISEKKAHTIEGKRNAEKAARKYLESIRDFRGKEPDKESQESDFMKLPLAEHRRIMKKQAEQMAAYYNKTAVEREEWQSGDFIDSLFEAVETTATRNKKR